LRLLLSADQSGAETRPPGLLAYGLDPQPPRRLPFLLQRPPRPWDCHGPSLLGRGHGS